MGIEGGAKTFAPYPLVDGIARESRELMTLVANTECRIRRA